MHRKPVKYEKKFFFNKTCVKTYFVALAVVVPLPHPTTAQCLGQQPQLLEEQQPTHHPTTTTTVSPQPATILVVGPTTLQPLPPVWLLLIGLFSTKLIFFLNFPCSQNHISLKKIIISCFSKSRRRVIYYLFVYKYVLLLSHY